MAVWFYLNFGLNFCTRVESNDPTCGDLSNVCKQCSLHVNNNKARGDTLVYYNKTPVVDVTTELCPSTNPITTMFTTELHIFKQQHIPTAN